MSEKPLPKPEKSRPDIRGYINPLVPGGLSEARQRASMTPGAEIYVETRKGDVILSFIKSLKRGGATVEVAETHYLAPGIGRSDKRRRILAERVKAIKAHKAVITETTTQRSSKKSDLPEMLLHAYEQIATSGRARKGKNRGAPIVYPKSGPMFDSWQAIWRSREYDNDPERHAAMCAKWGKNKVPSIGWLRREFGSPHAKKST